MFHQTILVKTHLFIEDYHFTILTFMSGIGSVVSLSFNIFVSFAVAMLVSKNKLGNISII